MPLPTPKGIALRDIRDKRTVESRNGYIQAKFVVQKISEWGPDSALDVDLLRELQRLAVNQVYRCAGHLRDGHVTIEPSDHQPPDPELVPSLVEEMCAYVRDNWHKSPVHLAA